MKMINIMIGKYRMQWDKLAGEPNLFQEVRKSVIGEVTFKLRSRGE